MIPYHERVVIPYDEVRTITLKEMTAFVQVYHYSKIMPKLNTVCYGGFRDGELVAAISFGWGTKPLHTIRKRFPSLTTEDYFEIGKLCLKDEESDNSESYFMSAAFKILQRQFPKLKIIFTWADGIWGRVGYIYQASNLLYGDTIWTDRYQTEKGECLHPRQLRPRLKAFFLQTPRPNPRELAELGWKHFKGKQFSYIKFLCDEVEERRLRAESPFTWTKTRARYPKPADLAWKQFVERGKWIPCEQPIFVTAWDSRQEVTL
jgi:hypothetical protein